MKKITCLVYALPLIACLACILSGDSMDNFPSAPFVFTKDATGRTNRGKWTPIIRTEAFIIYCNISGNKVTYYNDSHARIYNALTGFNKLLFDRSPSTIK